MFDSFKIGKSWVESSRCSPNDFLNVGIKIATFEYSCQPKILFMSNFLKSWSLRGFPPINACESDIKKHFLLMSTKRGDAQRKKLSDWGDNVTPSITPIPFNADPCHRLKMTCPLCGMCLHKEIPCV